MTQRRSALGVFCLPLVVSGVSAFSAASLEGQTQSGRVPTFQVDPAWPRNMPQSWVWRQRDLPQSDVLGINADAQDHVWVTHRGLVAEFDPQGNLVQSWDARGEPLPEWARIAGVPRFTTIHGLYIDHNDFVWTTAREQHMVLKFNKQGKLLLAIGTFNETRGSNDSTAMGRPAEVYVDAETNELYVADGYTNHRVIVYNAETGAYLRHWGAYGRAPDDEADDRPVQGAYAAVSQFRTPHGITGSRDGLIYVADRTNSRVQVFRRSGEFVSEAYTRRGTGGAFSVALSKDPQQEFVYVTDGTEHRIWIIRRSDMQVIGQFSQEGAGPGELGRPHNITVDSRGNIYVAEADPGRRAQKFTFRGFQTASAP
jgi:DNA-binding beta-propeller fold protein YncE